MVRAVPNTTGSAASGGQADRDPGGVQKRRSQETGISRAGPRPPPKIPCGRRSRIEDQQGVGDESLNADEM